MYLKNFPCIKYLKLYEPYGPLALFFVGAQNMSVETFIEHSSDTVKQKTKSRGLIRLLGLKQFWDEKQWI